MLAALLGATCAAPGGADEGTASNVMSDETRAARAQEAFDVFSSICFPADAQAPVAPEINETIEVSMFDFGPAAAPPATSGTSRDRGPGINRRCEISFAGFHADAARQIMIILFSAQPFQRPADIPESYRPADFSETTMLHARSEPPGNIMIYHVGNIQTDDSVRTHMIVERMKLPE